MTIAEKIERVYDMFETSFIQGRPESEKLILNKKWNIYFLLYDVKTPEEFDYKLLSWLSFYCADNHFKKNSAQCKWAWNRLNRWFRKEFTYTGLQVIYRRIGTGCNKDIGVEFIKSNLDMNKLIEEPERKE